MGQNRTIRVKKCVQSSPVSEINMEVFFKECMFISALIFFKCVILTHHFLKKLN